MILLINHLIWDVLHWHHHYLFHILNGGLGVMAPYIVKEQTKQIPEMGSTDAGKQEQNVTL